MSKDYKIGYRKPPKHTQFKAGKSGNPKGRPKGRKNMQTIMNDILNRTVTITENGKTRRVNFFEAFVHKFIAKALSGSTRDQIAVLKAIDEYAPELLKESDVPQSITVQFVDPDGKTMDFDSDGHLSVVTSDNDPKASPAQERPDPCSDEDDSWLDLPPRHRPSF